MKIKTKIILFTGIVLLSVIVISSVSLWTMNEIDRLGETIENGVELIAEARSLHSLMKDLMFDLFTPQTYRLLKDVLHTPRFQTTRRNFSTVVSDFQIAFYDFMDSPRVKSLLREEELRDAYTVAQVMSDKAFDRITAFQRNLDRLVDSGALGEESLYKQLQTGQDPSIPLFFEEVRDTSYYLTNNFESFLSHFVRSLQEQSSIIRRQIIILFWGLTALIGVIAMVLSLLLARLISQRIRSVEEGFHRVSLGDFTAQLDIRAKDEFGLLAGNFNLFMKDLKRNVDSVLNLMRDVGKSITERLSFRRILELIVESAVNDSNADGAAVLMKTEHGTIVVGKAAGIFPFPMDTELPEEVVKAACQNENGDPEAVLSLEGVFSRLKPLYIRDVEHWEGTSTFNPELEVGSLLAIPLVVSQRLLGVLCILTYGPDGALTDLDYTNFSTFGDYAALILDNFFKYKELLERREAEYKALQSQIQPHFLYNLLNSLIGLNRMGDRKSLEKAIFALKGMLRYTLEQNDWTTVTEELQFIKKYCELQQIRFQERLAVEIHCDEEAGSCRLPKLILQPLVENAIIHGIEPLGSPGKLQIAARRIRRNGSMKLRISITDNGVGFRTEIETEGRHIGLANVKERLLIAYAQASLEIESRPGRGACVAMEIVEQDGRL